MSADVDGVDLKPLFELLLDHIPAPTYDEGHPLQALVTNLDRSPYLGRLALCRVRQGRIERGQSAAWCRADGTIERVRISELFVTEGLERTSATDAGPGRSSPWPASTRSPSARPWPTVTTPAPCR